MPPPSIGYCSTDWTREDRPRSSNRNCGEEEQGSRYVAERLFERNFGYGYAWQNWVRSTVIDEAPVYYLEMMLKVRSLLARRVDTAPVQDRPHYKAMLYAVTQMIDQTDYK